MSINQPIYYIKHDGWFTFSYEAVSKSAFRAHQAEKSSWSFTSSVTALALGILAATQNLRSPYSSSAPALAVPALGLQLMSHLPISLAQSSPAPDPLGTEFRINTYTALSQRSPSVASFADGGFIVTFASLQQDGSDSGVFGQRFDASGAKVGSEFRINTYTTGYQADPSVALLANDGFIVTWTSDRQDGDGYGIFGQRFDASGAKVGSEFQINTYTTDWQADSSVASLAGGGFIVTWRTTNLVGPISGVFGQLFDPSGSKAGSEFQINTYTNEIRREEFIPSVASVTGGGFIVIWESNDQDGDGAGVFGQLFDPSGSKTGSEFQINTSTTEDQKSPSVTALAGGGFIATWISDRYDGSNDGVFGQLFDASGAKIGNEFQINTYTTDDIRSPSIASLTGGGFIVTWTCNKQDGSGLGIFGQLLDVSGAKVGPEFQINTYTKNNQENPSVAALAGSGFIVTWQSIFQDGSDYGVYGRRFDTSNAKLGTLQPPSSATTMQTVPPITMPSSTLITSVNTSRVANSTFSSNLPQSAPDTSISSLQRQAQITTIPSSSQTNFASSTSQRSPFSNLTQSDILLNPTPSPNTPSIPLIAGISSALGALFCSLSGGLIFYLRKQRQSKNPSKDGTQLNEVTSKTENAATSSPSNAHYDNFRLHVKKQTQNPGENQYADYSNVGAFSPQQKSHYNDLSERMKELAEAPPGNHYIGIEELNRQNVAFSNLSESPAE